VLHSSHHHCYGQFVVGLSDARFCLLEPIQLATAITSTIFLSFYHIVNKNQASCSHLQDRLYLGALTVALSSSPFPYPPWTFSSPLTPVSFFCCPLGLELPPWLEEPRFFHCKHYFCLHIQNLQIFKHIASL